MYLWNEPIETVVYNGIILGYKCAEVIIIGSFYASLILIIYAYSKGGYNIVQFATYMNA